MWSRYRRRASALSDQLKHKSWSWVPFSRMTRNEKMRVGRFSFLSLKNRKAREKLWKCHERMQKVQNLVTMCRYLHWFQIWPSGGATHIATLHWFAHWAMPNALLASSVELVSSSARKGLSVTSGPIDRTPGIPGSDKKELLGQVWKDDYKCKRTFRGTSVKYCYFELSCTSVKEILNSTRVFMKTLFWQWQAILNV